MSWQAWFSIVTTVALLASLARDMGLRGVRWAFALVPAVTLAIALRGALTGVGHLNEVLVTEGGAFAGILFITLGRPYRLFPDHLLPIPDDAEAAARAKTRSRAPRLLYALAIVGTPILVVTAWKTA